MGEFVALTAFRSEDPGAILDGVRGYLGVHGWPEEPVPAGEPVDGDNDVLAFPPVGGWTVVLWPRYYWPDPTSEFITGRVGGAASVARIHDGDYWTHTALRDGATLDRFASMPDYYTDDPAEIARMVADFAGQPAVVADVLGCPLDQVTPYLIHQMVTENLDLEGLLAEPPLAPAFEDDEYERYSPWVFVDFWRRAGITYPSDVSAYAARLRLAPTWPAYLPPRPATSL